MAKAYIQVRADEVDKEKATQILEELGTNLSAVVNMLLKQIIMTKSIPFEVKMSQPYTKEEIISEVKATMAMENMVLSDEDVAMLRTYQNTDARGRDAIRAAIVKEYSEV